MAADFSRIARTIADEIAAKPPQVVAAIGLLDEGATVPFIARYRKEVTGGLDDTQLRQLEERLTYLRDLEARRDTDPRIDPLAGQADRGARGEDRRGYDQGRARGPLPALQAEAPHPAEIARERGLGPLADAILADRAAVPLELAARLHHRRRAGRQGGARRRARHPGRDLRGERRPGRPPAHLSCKERAILHAKVVDGKQEAGAKFSDYFDHTERWATMPGHRALAMLRGRNEDVLTLDIEIDADEHRAGEAGRADDCRRLRDPPGRRARRPVAAGRRALDLAGEALAHAVARPDDASCASAPRKRRSAVFARNLKDLLLAAPAGSRADDRPRSRHPHRREGRGGRRHRQAAGDRHGLSVPAEERRARRAGRARRG